MSKTDIKITLFLACLLLIVVTAQVGGMLDLPLPWAAGREGQELTQVLTVSENYGGLCGNIELAVVDNYSLERAYLLRNGEIVDDFRGGTARATVYPDDKLAIDTSAYSEQLSFKLVNISRNIRSELLKRQILIKKKTVDIGVVVFK